MARFVKTNEYDDNILEIVRDWLPARIAENEQLLSELDVALTKHFDLKYGCWNALRPSYN